MSAFDPKQTLVRRLSYDVGAPCGQESPQGVAFSLWPLTPHPPGGGSA